MVVEGSIPAAWAARRKRPETCSAGVSVDLGDVEIDAAVYARAALADFGVERAGDDVARRGLHAFGVVVGHEALAATVDQTHARLGKQPAAGGDAAKLGRMAKGRRRELEELEVGKHRPGLERQHVAAAGGEPVVAGEPEELAGATGGQHNGASFDPHKPAGAIEIQEPAEAPGGRAQETGSGRLFEHPHAPLAHPLAQRSHQVARAAALAADRTRTGVAGHGEKFGPPVALGEANAEPRESFDRRARFADECLGDVGKEEVAPGAAHVGQVQRGRVLRIETGLSGKAAARQMGVTGLAEPILEDERDLGPGLAGRERRTHPGDAAADDGDPGPKLRSRHRLRRPRPSPARPVSRRRRAAGDPHLARQRLAIREPHRDPGGPIVRPGLRRIVGANPDPAPERDADQPPRRQRLRLEAVTRKTKAGAKPRQVPRCNSSTRSPNRPV